MQTNTVQAKEQVKGISLRVIIVLSIFTILLLALLFIAQEIVLEGETGFDTKAFALLQSITIPGTTKVVEFLTFFGSTKFLLPAYILVALYFIIFKRNTHRSFNVAAIGVSSACLLFIIKHIFRRHRPPSPLIKVSGFSFPSGHSFSSFTFCGIFIYILWRSNASLLWKWIGSVLLFLFAASIALSRVYLHVHYASDVVAGFCLSFLWLTICAYVLHKMQLNKNAAT